VRSSSRLPGVLLRRTSARDQPNDERDETSRRLAALERKVDAVESLLRIGTQVVTGVDSKTNALIDSHTRLYDSIRQLAETQAGVMKAQAATEASLRQFSQATEASLRQLSEAQAATDRSLKKLIDSLTHRNGNAAV
jgi:uncharacterized protein YoxC